MSDAPDLLFVTDHQRFVDAVVNDDAEARLAAFDNFDDVALCEIARYGLYNREEMIAPLASFYQNYMMQISEERRLRIFGHIKDLVEKVSHVSTNAFLPFIAEDTSRAIVSTSVIDYASLGPLSDGDPMSRVKDIIGMIESGRLKNEGAAFGALLHIGDERVCKLLLPLRDSLEPDAINEAVKCATGFIHSAVVDFYLDWLEGLGGDYHDGLFGIVASGLGLLKKKAATDQVATGYRPFPVQGVEPEQWKEMIRPIALAAYLKRIGPRMYALERAEPPPRVMPHVLAEWGLQPLTEPTDTAQLDDRSKLPAVAPAGFNANAGRGNVDVSQEWWDGEGQIFLAWGILNPNGPTLYVLGSKQVEGGHRIFMRWLHMLGGSTTYAADTVDQISYQRIYDDATSIHEHLVRQQQPGLFQVIPSFLIVNRQDPTLARIAADLVSNCGGASESWGRHMAYLRQFGADFFGLAGAQIREYYDDAMAKAKSAGHEPSEFIRSIELRYGHLPEFINATIPASSPSPMTPGLRDEWWRVISARDYKVQALASLKAMWDGASSLMSDEYKDRMVPWDAALGFLARFGLTLEAE